MPWVFVHGRMKQAPAEYTMPLLGVVRDAQAEHAAQQSLGLSPLLLHYWQTWSTWHMRYVRWDQLVKGSQAAPETQFACQNKRHVPMARECPLALV